jgi:hypothetical protein
MTPGNLTARHSVSMIDRIHRPLAPLMLLLAGLLTLGAACGVDTDERDPDDWFAEEDAGTDGGEMCPADDQFFCVDFCGSDAARQAECVDGAWQCPGSSVRESNCPPDTGCGGAPPPRNCISSCSDENYRTQTCVQGRYVCPEGTFEDDGRCAEQDCEIIRETQNLPGVQIEFPGQCEWPVDRVRDGISIPYEVVVDEAVGGVIPEPTDAGGCDRPGESGLILGETIAGNDQKWCRCDTGLCMEPNYEPRTLEPGSYRGEITWEGHNWNGPSDYGAERGELFPPGTYKVHVEAVGQRARPDDGNEDFRVESTLKIELTE